MGIINVPIAAQIPNTPTAILLSTNVQGALNELASGNVGGVTFTLPTTVGKLSKWSGASAITDSIISDDGSTATIAGNLLVSGNVTLGDNLYIKHAVGGNMLGYNTAIPSIQMGNTTSVSTKMVSASTFGASYIECTESENTHVNLNHTFYSWDESTELFKVGVSGIRTLLNGAIGANSTLATQTLLNLSNTSTFNLSGIKRGAHIVVTDTATSGATGVIGVNLLITKTGTNAAPNRGILATVTNGSSANISVGSFGVFQGTLTTTAGQTGTIAEARGLYLLSSYAGSGVIALSIGADIANYGAAEVTNAYGLRIATQSGATVGNYGIAVEGNFNGFGILAPTQRMHVVGNTILDGNITLGTTTAQLIGLWGAAPIAQPASANQAALSLDVDVTGVDLVDKAAIDTNFTNIQTLVNQLRADMVSAGLIKGSA